MMDLDQSLVTLAGRLEHICRAPLLHGQPCRPRRQALLRRAVDGDWIARQLGRLAALKSWRSQQQRIKAVVYVLLQPQVPGGPFSLRWWAFSFFLVWICYVVYMG